MIEKAHILKEIKQAVLEVDSKAEVVLFGSRARGDFHAESDWDVLILVDKEEKDWKHRRVIIDKIYEVELRNNEIITPIVRNKSFWEDISVTPLYQEVKRDGLLL